MIQDFTGTAAPQGIFGNPGALCSRIDHFVYVFPTFRRLASPPSLQLRPKLKVGVSRIGRRTFAYWYQ